MSSQEPKILIVGAGPTGLTSALVLAQKGIRPRIIDKRQLPITTSNALAIQPRTLELWEEMQLIDDALELGHRLHGLTLSTPSKLLGKINFNNLPTKYSFILALPQAKTERLLIQHLSKYGIEVEREVSLNNLVQHDDCVEVCCNDKTDNFSWVVGCDGANSTVRELGKFPFEGEDLPQHFIMADINIAWNKSPDNVHVIVSNNGPLAFFPLDGKGFGRLVIDVTGDKLFKDHAKPALESFQKLMNERSGLETLLSNPTWTSSFWIQSRVAKSYRKNRLFLAGDAAHRHSPFGGQGLNTGVQDAYFLASLLADAIKKGKVDELKNYETIRRPIGEQIVHRTFRMTQIMTSRNKLVQAIRNFLLPKLLQIRPLRHKVKMSFSQLIYRNN